MQFYEAFTVPKKRGEYEVDDLDNPKLSTLQSGANGCG